MIYVAVSIIALAAGPLLYIVSRRAVPYLAFLDGFVLVGISGLLLVHVIPHSMEDGGLWVPLVALAGFFVPQLVEHTLERAAGRAHAATLALALVGLVIHAGLDGVALTGPSEDGAGGQLAAAIVLHRLPVAITIWALLAPIWGGRLAAAVLAAIGAATLAGYGLGDVLAGAEHSVSMAIFQALVAGSLLHVVVHRPAPLTSPTRGTRIGKLASGGGALVAIIAVALFSEVGLTSHLETGGGFAVTFVAISLEIAPVLLLAVIVAGLAQAVLPQVRPGLLSTGRPASESVRGAAFGLICSSRGIPLYQTLVDQSVPATAALAFLVAAPALGIDAALISLPLLGGELTLIRVIAVAAVAIAIGWGIGRMAPRPAAPATTAVARRSIAERVRDGLRFGLADIVDHTGPWLLLGIAAAALVEPALEGEWLAVLPFGVDVAVFTLIGIPAYVCASGATPLAAVLIYGGVSPGAAIAFLLAGPAANLTTFGIVAGAHGRRIAIAFAVAMAGLSMAVGLAINLVVPERGGFATEPLYQQSPGVLAMVCLGVLAVIFALSVLRQGPRGFIGQVLSPYGDDDGHGHDHAH